MRVPDGGPVHPALPVPGGRHLLPHLLPRSTHEYVPIILLPYLLPRRTHEYVPIILQPHLLPRRTHEYVPIIILILLPHLQYYLAALTSMFQSLSLSFYLIYYLYALMRMFQSLALFF